MTLNFIYMIMKFILCMLFGMAALVIGILQPSLYTELSRCSLDDLTSQQQRDMFQCFIRCQQNPCCRTVNVTGSCQQLHTLSQNADFVKNVSMLKRKYFVHRFQIVFCNYMFLEQQCLYFLFQFTDRDDCLYCQGMFMFLKTSRRSWWFSFLM